MLRNVGFMSAIFVAANVVLTASAYADDQDVIDYRQHIMKTMGEQAAAVGMIVEHRIPPDNFAVHAQILAVTAASAKKAFEPKVLGGEAKPEVWAKWADFSKRLDVLVTNTAELSKVAKDGGFAAAEAKLSTALTCKGCHEVYRVPKK